MSRAPTGVEFYSGDSETFTWDQTTGRMTGWDSSVGSQQQIGTLTWNANGTLQSLQIKDTANNPNTQTCTYGYDDLARLKSGVCSGSLKSLGASLQLRRLRQHHQDRPFGLYRHRVRSLGLFEQSSVWFGVLLRRRG